MVYVEKRSARLPALFYEDNEPTLERFIHNKIIRKDDYGTWVPSASGAMLIRNGVNWIVNHGPGENGADRIEVLDKNSLERYYIVNIESE